MSVQEISGETTVSVSKGITELVDVLKMMLAEKLIEQWERAKLPECPICKRESGQFIRVGVRRVCVRCARKEETRLERRRRDLNNLASNPIIRSMGFVKGRKI